MLNFYKINRLNKKFSLTLLFLSSFSIAHPFYHSISEINLLSDAGFKWDQLSMFNATSFYNINFSDNYTNGFDRINKIDFYFKKSGKALAINKNNTFQEFFYTYLNIHFVDVFQNYSSGFGFQNNWVNLQLGRGREGWGAGSNIHLAMNDKSKPYDYFKLSSNYGNLRVSYIHGFLEKLENNINRYINARGIEWTNRSWLIIGLSETIIYSGENRSLDIGYLNPIGSHLEVEMNNRLNVFGTSSSNAVWQIHMDMLLKKRSRISINYLLDELVIDPTIEIGKENGSALSFRYSFCTVFKNKNLFNITFSYVNVGTPTFRHGQGMNNFVNKNYPLGWYEGSDSENFEIGLNYLDEKKILVGMYFKNLRFGEESIFKRPYEPYKDYIKDKFPSGKVTRVNSMNFNLLFKTKLNLDVMVDYEITLENKKYHAYLIGTGINIK